MSVCLTNTRDTIEQIAEKADPARPLPVNYNPWESQRLVFELCGVCGDLLDRLEAIESAVKKGRKAAHPRSGRGEKGK